MFVCFSVFANAQNNQTLNDNHFWKQQVAPTKHTANNARLGGGYQQPLTTTVYLMDSMKEWIWDTTTHAWNNNLVIRTIFTLYDCHNNITNESSDFWNSSTSTWQSGSTVQISYTYNANNNITSELITVTSGTNVNQYQFIKTYNTNNLITDSLIQFWSGAWVNGSQTTNTYNANNKITNQLTQQWNTTTSAWVNNQQYTYTYNTNNNMTIQLQQTWNTTTSAWDNLYLYTYTYDANNNQISYLQQTWNTTTSAWDNYAQYTNTYDANNNNTSYIVQLWYASTNTWVNSGQETETYDVNNNKTSYIVQLWYASTNTWKNQDSLHYHYNSINWPLTLSISGNQAIFLGSSTTLTASGANTYMWSANAGSATTASVSVTPTVTTTYTVTGANGGCVMTQTVTVIVTTAPDICMVSTDSATNYQYNIIHWDNTLYPTADSFIVYRYGSTSYLKLGTVSKDSSRFIDANRSIGGPNGGNPNVAGWQYALAIKDLAGNVSAKSPYHVTANFQQNNQNLSWSAYIIQSPQSNPTSGYEVLRDSLGINDFRLFANTSALTTSAQDPSYASYPLAQYRVDALGFNCASNQRLSGGGNNTYTIRVRSHSNTNRQAGNGIQTHNQAGFNTFSYGNAIITNGTIPQGQQLRVYNTLGQVVLTTTLQNNIETNLPSGIYTIQVIDNTGSIIEIKKCALINN